MEGQKCKCGHHGFSTLVMVLGSIATVLFLYTVWTGNGMFSLSSDAYFQHVVVFGFLTLGMRNCKCCCDAGCGKNCGTGVCMPEHNHGDMKQM